MTQQEIQKIVAAQRAYFATGATKKVETRIAALKRLRDAIQKYEREILDALRQDLGKSSCEAYMTEVGIVLEEIRYQLAHIKRWTRPKRKSMPIVHFGASCRTFAEPYGVSLILSPWNYPFQLTFDPLVGALAAGNCVVLKPSAYASNTAAIMGQIIEMCFDSAYVAVVHGGRAENQSLLEEQFDYIFFTGGVDVGRVVMTAAAQHLTPVTLELGGKSPCIVDETADLETAAQRIVFGKFVNAGQTCVAPDYLYVHTDVKEKLVDQMRQVLIRLYGTEPLRHPDYPKIVNEKHFDRLLGLCKDADFICGGTSNRGTMQIAPTLIDHAAWDMPVMGEEIFGPLLPILTFSELDAVVAEIKRHPKPLALYYFSTDRMREAHLLRELSFGGGCINDTLIHVSSSTLPFGGVGASGMGQYHGKASFDTFSHYKSVVKKSNVLDLPTRFPPHSEKKLRLLKWMMR